MAASSYPLPSFITLYSISEADGTVIAGQEQSGQRSLIKLLAVMSLWPTLPYPCMNSPAKLHSLRSQSGPSSGSSPPLSMTLWACTRVYGPEFKFPVGKLEAYHTLGHCASSSLPMTFSTWVCPRPGPPRDFCDAVEFSKTTPSGFPSIFYRKCHRNLILYRLWSLKTKRHH